MIRNRIIPSQPASSSSVSPRDVCESDLYTARDAIREQAKRDEVETNIEQCLTPIVSAGLSHIRREVRVVLVRISVHHRIPVSALTDEQIFAWWRDWR